MPSTRSKRAREEREEILANEAEADRSKQEVAKMQAYLKYLKDKQAGRMHGQYKFTLDLTQCEENYVNNVKEGPCRYDTPNGTKIDSNYKNGKLEGWESVTTDNQHRIQRFYVAGVKQGVEIHCHPDGTISLDNMVDGVKSGRGLRWLPGSTMEAVQIVDHDGSGGQRSSIVYRVLDGMLYPISTPDQVLKAGPAWCLLKYLESVRGKMTDSEFLSLFNAAMRGFHPFK